MSCIAVRKPAASDRGSPVVLSTIDKLRYIPASTSIGNCSYGTNSVGWTAASNACFVSPTTPTISIMGAPSGPSVGLGVVPSCARAPSTWFAAPAKNRFTNVSLTIAIAADRSRSRGVKPRPATSGMPSARKYPSVTAR